MKVKYIKRQRGKGGYSYAYERRVPKDLVPILGKEWIRKGLRTSDLSVAVQRAEVENKWLENLAGANAPQALYNEWLKQANIDAPLNNPDEWNPADDIYDELIGMDQEEAEIYIASLSPSDQARFHAARTWEKGITPPSRYRYSLKNAHDELLEVKSRHLKDKTLGAYSRALDAFVGAGVAPEVDKITRPDVINWMNEQLLHISPKTVSNWMVYLGQMYQHAIDIGKLDEGRANVFRGHRTPKRNTEHYQEMTQEQLLAILPLLREDDQVAAQVGWYTGMRISEVLAATIDTVDNILCFHVAEGKTAAATRWIPMHTALIPILGSAEQATEITGDYSKRFGRAKKKAFPEAGRSLGFHSLRVAFISHALRAGHAEADVARVVGHEGAKGQLETGRTYYRGQTLAQMQDIVESIPRLI